MFNAIKKLFDDLPDSDVILAMDEKSYEKKIQEHMKEIAAYEKERTLNIYESNPTGWARSEVDRLSKILARIKAKRAEIAQTQMNQNLVSFKQTLLKPSEIAQMEAGTRAIEARAEAERHLGIAYAEGENLVLAAKLEEQRQQQQQELEQQKRALINAQHERANQLKASITVKFLDALKHALQTGNTVSYRLTSEEFYYFGNAYRAAMADFLQSKGEAPSEDEDEDILFHDSPSSQHLGDVVLTLIPVTQDGKDSVRIEIERQPVST